MKSLLLGILFLGFIAVGGYVIFQKYKSAQPIVPNSSLNVTLSGEIKKVSGNSEYSYQISDGKKITGINSSRTDLSVFEGQNVTVTGQYSGTVLYVDKVVLPK